MLSFKEASLKAGIGYPTSLRQLAEGKKISAPISLKWAIAASFIDSYWYLLGGSKSKLGRPITGLSSKNDSNFVRSYRGGAIHFFSSTAGTEAYQQYETQVYFTKLHCINESGEWSSKDEPYGVLAVYAPESGNVLGIKKIPDGGGGHYSVNEGKDYYEGTTGAIWVGPPQPLKIVCALMENDEGDADEIKKKIQDKIQEVVNGALGKLDLDDMALIDGGFMDDALKYLSLGISSIVVGVLGLGDDKIGYTIYPLDKPYITYEELINPDSHPDGRFRFSCVLGDDSEGKYEISFEIVTREFVEVVGPGA